MGIGYGADDGHKAATLVHDKVHGGINRSQATGEIIDSADGQAIRSQDHQGVWIQDVRETRHGRDDPDWRLREDISTPKVPRGDVRDDNFRLSRCRQDGLIIRERGGIEGPEATRRVRAGGLTDGGGGGWPGGARGGRGG